MSSARPSGLERDDCDRRAELAGEIRTIEPDPRGRPPPDRVAKKTVEADYPYSFDYDDEEPLSLAEEIAAGGRQSCPTTSTTATNSSSSRAIRTSPNCSGCRWPS